MTMDEAVQAVRDATAVLVKAREAREAAGREETIAVNSLNKAQEQLDDMIRDFRQRAPHGTDWNRPRGGELIQSP